MAFYIMKQDTLIPGSAMVGGVPDEIDSLEWMKGEVSTAVVNDLVLSLSASSGKYRGHILEGLVTLFHQELKDTLDQLDVVNVHYYPVKIQGPGKSKKEDGYYLIKIEGMLDCIDMERSRVKPWVTGIGVDFLSMAIDASKTDGLKIFRLKQDPTKIIINEALKLHFDKTDMLVGVTLLRTEEYSDW